MLSWRVCMGVQTKRVLATRPADQNRAWSAKIREAGFRTLELPLLAIEPLDDTAALNRLRQQILDFDQNEIVIFVSQNAVHYACDWLEDYWPQAPLGIQYFAVGKQTANQLEQRLRHYGVPVLVAADTMNTEALLAHPELQAEQVHGRRLLICRGAGGRPTLGDTLQARGAQVVYCELYRRAVPEAAARQLAAEQLRPEQDLLVLFSGETLSNALTVAAQAGQLEVLLQLPLLVPGERVAAQARAAGFQQVSVAHNASEDCMLQTLMKELPRDNHDG